MAITGRVWSFTESREWSNEPGGNLAAALNTIGDLVERHGDLVHFIVTDLPNEQQTVDGVSRPLAKIRMEVIVAPGNPQIEQRLADLGLEFVGYRPATLTVASKQLRFLGEPIGEGPDRLKSELRRDLAGIERVRTAYISRVQDGEDGRIRIAICIESPTPSRQLATQIGSLCSSLLTSSSTMDIFFSADLPAAQWQQLQQVAKPFFESGGH